MEFTNDEKQTFELAHRLLYAKGLNTPQEAEVGLRLTQLLNKLFGAKPPAKEPMLKNKEKEGKTDGGK